MNLIPLYWARKKLEIKTDDDELYEYTVYGWSCSNQDAAEQHAEKRSQELKKRVLDHDLKSKSYGYLCTAIREEVVETVIDEGDLQTVITRNRYGALVLNSNHLLIADIDLPKTKPGFFASLFGSDSKERGRAQVLEVIERYHQNNPSRSFALYHTKNGFRLIFLDKDYRFDDQEVHKAFNDLNVDPLYSKLTQFQKCFRARLTPKPWRLYHPNPPNSFPFETEDHRIVYQRWLEEYNNKSNEFSVCRKEKVYGNPNLSASAAKALDVHDRFSCGTKALA